MVLARIDLAANDLSNSAKDLSNALHLEPQNAIALNLRQTLQARGQQIP